MTESSRLNFVSVSLPTTTLPTKCILCTKKRGSSAGSVLPSPVDS
ncbi:unnamed protein product [Larinioides sclopetarius]|uniref:Uncharacterized protein n=1 Tax=Larinioides sclopetarius TaxID=280406 RepID=A0AAV1YSW0_9ARAC